MKMICRFVYEGCPADCAHRQPHAEIFDDDFGEHSPCILAGDCNYCGVPTYCIPVAVPDLLEALKPFAEKCPDDDRLAGKWDHPVTITIRLKHLRQARAALERARS